MKYCPYCGAGLQNDMVFCPKCGKKYQGAADAQVAESRQIDYQNDIQAERTAAAEKQLPSNAANSRRSKTRTAWIGIATAIFSVLVIAIGILLIPKQPTTNNPGTSTPPTTTPTPEDNEPVSTSEADINTDTKEPLTATEIATLSSSVLTLYVYDRNHELIATGSGFIAYDDKTLVTNFHVIDQGYYVEAVSESDIHYNLTGAVFHDESMDIAILKFEQATGLPTLPIADSSELKIGETVYAIGSPLGLKNTVSNGIISAIRDNGTYSDIQFTAPISSGSSGGVLLNEFGEAVGITYASYQEGQNLNLAIPSAEFEAWLSSSKLLTFSDLVAWYAPLGNTIENYSANETRLVQHRDFIYESFNGDKEVIAHNIKTGAKTSLGIYGTNLSVYRGLLYYVSISKQAVGTYDLDTGEHVENILLRYSGLPTISKITHLFVTKHGITVLNGTLFSEQKHLIQMDFERTIVGIKRNIPFQKALASSDYVVLPDYEKQQLTFVSLADLTEEIWTVDFEPGSISADSNGSIYVSNTENNDYNELVRVDLYTGEWFSIGKRNAASYGCGVHDGRLYYKSDGGTMCMSSLGGEWTLLTSVYQIGDMCFADDGTSYGMATKLPETGIELEYTQYFLKIDPNLKDIEVLDTALFSY